MEFEFVWLGHTQFEALTKYCTTYRLVEMEFQVKVSWFELISESVIFGGGKISTKDSIIIVSCNQKVMFMSIL